MNTIYVSTREYELAHGKLPRGRGMWAFFFDHNNRIEDVFWSRPNMLYKEAVKMAKTYATAKGYTYIEVGS